MKKYIAALALGVAAISLPAAAKPVAKPTFVLVHGAFEDASVWKAVVADLGRDGYKAVAVDLPGRPSDPLSPDKTSLTVYRDAVLADIAKVKGPVMLVGHSFGGLVISEVAEAAPEKVRTLVYVAAYLPRDGDSLVTLATADKASAAGPHIQFDKEHGVASIERSARADLFATDGSPELRAAIPDLILDEPLPPLAEPVHLTARFAGVDKTYVHTALDRVVSPQEQALMISTTPVRAEFTVDTGHTPFLTNPDALVKALEASVK